METLDEYSFQPAWPEPTHPEQDIDTLIVFGRGREAASTPEGTTIAPAARERVATAIDFAATHPSVKHIIFTGGKTPGDHLGNDTSRQYGPGYRGAPEGISMLTVADRIIDDLLTNGYFTNHTARRVRLSARSYSWDTPTDLWHGLAAVERTRLEQNGGAIGLVAQSKHLQRGLRIARSISTLPIIGIVAGEASDEPDHDGLLSKTHTEMIMRAADYRRLHPHSPAIIERHSRRAWWLQALATRPSQPHHFPDTQLHISGAREVFRTFVHRALEQPTES